MKNLSPASFIFILAIAILMFGFQNCAPIAEQNKQQIISIGLVNAPEIQGKSFTAQEEVFNCESTADTVCAALYSRLLDSPIHLEFNSDLSGFSASNACHQVTGSLTILESSISFQVENISTSQDCSMSSPENLLADLQKLSDVQTIRKTGIGIVLEGASFKFPFSEM